MRALKSLGADVDFLLPDRFKLGYGLSPEIVDVAAEQSPDLIITVDNGIASLEGVARAQQHGIATLITDHHLPARRCPSRLHRQSQPARLRLPVQVHRRRRRHVLRHARPARRTA
jgi:single-stranded DNA-specific DHH superfamily exonuclease